MGHYARNGKWYPGPKETPLDYYVRHATTGHYASDGRWYPGPRETPAQYYARKARNAFRCW